MLYSTLPVAVCKMSHISLADCMHNLTCLQILSDATCDWVLELRCIRAYLRGPGPVSAVCWYTGFSVWWQLSLRVFLFQVISWVPVSYHCYASALSSLVAQLRLLRPGQLFPKNEIVLVIKTTTKPLSRQTQEMLNTCLSMHRCTCWICMPECVCSLSCHATSILRWLSPKLAAHTGIRQDRKTLARILILSSPRTYWYVECIVFHFWQ